MKKGRVGRSGNSSFLYNSEIFGKHDGGPQSFEIISVGDTADYKVYVNLKT